MTNTLGFPSPLWKRGVRGDFKNHKRLPYYFKNTLCILKIPLVVAYHCSFKIPLHPPLPKGECPNIYLKKLSFITSPLLRGVIRRGFGNLIKTSPFPSLVRRGVHPIFLLSLQYPLKLRGGW
jgi:hypothetical protein